MSTFVMSAIIAFIENRVGNQFSNVELEKAIGLSTSRIRSIFKHYMGKPLSRYITERKIAHAAFSIIHDENSILDIAMKYGFTNPDTFTRTFRRITGMNPSQFRKQRQTAGRMPLHNGFYGVSEKQGGIDEMNKPFEGSMVLYGVPKVGYGVYGCTPFPICLKSVANYLGEDVDYDYIMSMCGAAFRLTWDVTGWYGGNVDICYTFDEFETVYKYGVEGLGREYSVLERDKNTKKQDYIDFIKFEIDNGRPCIATGIIGPPEACIITGYRDNGETLLGWNFFQDNPVFGSKNTTIDDSGYFISSDWWENEGTQSVMSVGKSVGDKFTIKEIVGNGIEVLSGRRKDQFAKGILAYDAWKAAINNVQDFSNNLPMMSERMMCQGDAMDCLGDGRSNASKFFQKLYDADTSNILAKEIAAHFNTVVENVQKMTSTLGGWERGEKQMNAFSMPEKRCEISKLITKCKDADAMALEKMKELYRIMSV